MPLATRWIQTCEANPQADIRQGAGMNKTAMLSHQTLSEQILSMNKDMQELAASGEWQQVFELLTTRNALLLELEDSERPAALLAAKHSTEQILLLAEKARTGVAKKLTGLVRGKKATDSYRSHA